MSKLEFKIVEIPEGESRRVVELGPDDLDLSPYVFENGEIELDFNRTRNFIQVDYLIHAGVQLVCDRSLEPFIYPVNKEYEVVFKTDVEVETEDEKAAIRSFNFSSNSFSIEHEVRDSVLLAVPMQKIHPKYVDEEGHYKNFETKSFGKPSEDTQNEPPIDPRWEALKQLKD